MFSCVLLEQFAVDIIQSTLRKRYHQEVQPLPPLSVGTLSPTASFAALFTAKETTCEYKFATDEKLSVFARAERMHVLHELIHTYLPICTFHIFILLFSIRTNNYPIRIVLNLRVNPTNVKGPASCISFLRDLSTSGPPLVVRDLKQGRRQRQR